MPPPPPPSKSYLIKITDEDLLSSDDEEEELAPQVFAPQQTFQSIEDVVKDNNKREGERIHHHETTKIGLDEVIKEDHEVLQDRGVKPPVPREDTPETVMETEHDDEKFQNTTRDGMPEKEEDANLVKQLEKSLENSPDEKEDVPEEQDAADGATGATSAVESDAAAARRKRRNRKKKLNKKRKKQHNAAAAVVEQAAQKTQQRRIHFGSVVVQTFDRVLGETVVPLDGGWPLGLGTEAIETETLSVDEYEVSKQARLLQRYQKWKGDAEEAATEVPQGVLETRQWDYKRRTKNPLFCLLIEKERMAILLGEQDADAVWAEKFQKEHDKKEKEKSGPKSPNTRSKKRHQQNGSRSPSSSSKGSHRRSRSGSGFHNQGERYNEQFTQYDVHHVRNELETLRNLRSQTGALGCTCRRLDVYIPPPNAGKKAAHRRLSVQKVKEELRKRHALPTERCSREELELKLHSLVAEEPCCRDDNNCPCVKNGINCQSDACQCWHASHQGATNSGKKASSSANSSDNVITTQMIETRCSNQYGMYTVDVDHIDRYRQPFLTFCQPVGGETGATDPK